MLHHILSRLTRNAVLWRADSLGCARRKTQLRGVVNKSMNNYKSSQTALKEHKYNRVLNRVKERARKRTPSLSTIGKQFAGTSEISAASRAKETLPRIGSGQKPLRSPSKDATPRKCPKFLAGAAVPKKPSNGPGKVLGTCKKGAPRDCLLSGQSVHLANSATRNKTLLSTVNGLPRKQLSSKSKHGLRQVAPTRNEADLRAVEGVEECLAVPDESSLQSMVGLMNELRTATHLSATGSFKANKAPLKENLKSRSNRMHLTVCNPKRSSDNCASSSDCNCSELNSSKHFHTHDEAHVNKVIIAHKVHVNGLETSELRTAEGSHRTLQRTLRAANSNHSLSNTNLHHGKTSPMPQIAECESPPRHNPTASQAELEAASRKLLVKNKEGVFLHPALDCGKGFSGVRLAVYEVKYVEAI